MPISPDAWKVIAAFQRFVKNNDKGEIDQFSLSDLEHADQQLGQKDLQANFRLAIKSQIAEIHKNEGRKHDSRVRALQVIVGVISALAVAGLSKYLFGL